MAYPYARNKYSFTPKKPVRSFRDLEVYQRLLDCSVVIVKDLRPKLKRLRYDFCENMAQTAMHAPFFVAEAHGLRFSDFKLAVATLEKAMFSCNRMIVYLEQSAGIFGSRLPLDLIEDLMKRYVETRGKMFRLEKSWEKYRGEN